MELLEQVLEILSKISQDNEDIDSYIIDSNVPEVKAKISDINDSVLSIKSILNIK